ncbi:hypothetical protein HYPDE_34418 [Hyphomicrobium denitrificans 1NES1]|uniref:Uncharacterized protein n=1 Tax=Hyphomicrobium denitrificans 1NES1 TaxID=670307 RepID=N0BEM7_9HYPH|nr:hypothetical protein [Hyphomicrobium denitrificans]AGK58555.1 hypothetical protein HYPDE_34418 [Hyphomicrobium denitrificans 1NES1]
MHRSLFFCLILVGLFIEEPSLGIGAAQPIANSSANSVTLFQTVSPFLVGALGAFLTYFFTARHERIKAAEEQKKRRSQLAIALSTELEGVANVIGNRLEVLRNLSRSNRNGGHSIEKAETSKLFNANLDTLGLLGASALKPTIEAYKYIAVMPKTVRVRAGLQGIGAETFDEISVAPNSEGLRDILGNHDNVCRSIAEAVRSLQALI